MSDHIKTPTRKPRKMRVIMLRNYVPEGKDHDALRDDLGRLPKGAMVEFPKKLAEALIDKQIAEKPE